VSMELPLDSPAPEEERSPRKPGRDGGLEAVVRVGAGALAAVGLIHLRRKSEIGGLQVKERNRRAIERVDDLVRRPSRGRHGIVHGYNLLISGAVIPVEIQRHAARDLMLNARAVL